MYTHTHYAHRCTPSAHGEGSKDSDGPVRNAQHLAAAVLFFLLTAGTQQLFERGHYLPEKWMRWRLGCNQLCSSLSFPKAQPMENNFIFTLP